MISSILWLGASLKEILTLDISESKIYPLFSSCFVGINVTSYYAGIGEYINISPRSELSNNSSHEERLESSTTLAMVRLFMVYR